MEHQQKLSHNEIKQLAALLLPALKEEMAIHFGQGYLKFNDACEYLGGISRNTLDKAVFDGKINKYSFAGGTILFKKSELDNLPPMKV